MQRRIKGSGTIQERGVNKWRIRYQVPSEDGKRKWGSQTIKGTRKMAEKSLRQKLVVLDSGDYVPKTKETVGDFFQSFVNGHCATKLTPKSAQGYKGYLDRYCQPISKLPLQGLPPAKIQNIYAALRVRNLSNTTILQLHRVLHKAFAVAVREGKLTRNPCDAVTPPKKNSKQAEVWDTDDLERFKKAAQDTRYYDVYRLALRTGMRRSEITGLRWCDVDLATGTLSVTQTLQRVTGKGLYVGQPKTPRSRRSIALSEGAVEILRNIQGGQLERKTIMEDIWVNSGYVVTNPFGKPLDPNLLTRDFRSIVTKNQLPHLTFHGLRHLAATLLLKEGKSPKIVSELLGHSTITVTMDIYSHVLPNMQREAVQSLDQYL